MSGTTHLYHHSQKSDVMLPTTQLRKAPLWSVLHIKSSSSLYV